MKKSPTPLRCLSRVATSLLETNQNEDVSVFSNKLISIREGHRNGVGLDLRRVCLNCRQETGVSRTTPSSLGYLSSLAGIYRLLQQNQSMGLWHAVADCFYVLTLLCGHTVTMSCLLSNIKMAHFSGSQCSVVVFESGKLGYFSKSNEKFLV